MSISIPTKVAAGVLTGGTVVVGGAFIYRGVSKEKVVDNKKSIFELVKTSRRDRRFISKSENGSSEEWREAWKLYATDYKDHDKNPFYLTLEKPSSVVGNAPVEFMNKCKFLSQEMVDDEKDSKYGNVLKYCTRATLVRDLISENYPNKKILTSEVRDEDGWNAAWSQYKANNTRNSDVWQITDWPESEDNAATSIFKTRCGEKMKLAAFKNDNVDYTNAVKWCTN